MIYSRQALIEMLQNVVQEYLILILINIEEDISDAFPEKLISAEIVHSEIRNQYYEIRGRVPTFLR